MTNSDAAAAGTFDDPAEGFARLRLVPTIVIDDPSRAVGLASALKEGGLPCAEVTFRTAGAGESLRRMVDAHPDMLIGAGTVLTVRQAAEARDAGARFIVSPGFNPAMVDFCLAHGMPVYPGVCTPTEIEAALSHGLAVLKFFPAEAMGGVKFLRAISAPYSMIRFMPTGGVDAGNLGDYLALPSVIACGGSWMAPPQWIAAGEFQKITEETARAVGRVKSEG